LDFSHFGAQGVLASEEEDLPIAVEETYSGKWCADAEILVVKRAPCHALTLCNAFIFVRMHKYTI